MLVLLLPSGMQLVHSFESHEHSSCSELKAHIHKKELDCSLCDFQHSTYSFSTENLNEFLSATPNFSLELSNTPSEYIITPECISLRGPPSLV